MQAFAVKRSCLPAATHGHRPHLPCTSIPRFTIETASQGGLLATVARWRSEGMGPAFLKLRGHVRYRLEDIESFERQTLQSATGCKSELTNPQD